MRLAHSVLIALTLAALGATSVLAAPSDPFKGSWRSIDADGSNQSLAFGGNGATRMVTLRDDNATTPACGGGPAVGRGVGEVDGDTIGGTFSLRCASGAVFDADFEFTYDQATNTLTDSFGGGVVWTRP